MSNVVCLPYHHLLILFCIFIGFAVLYIHYDKKSMLAVDPNYEYEDRILNKVIKTINATQAPQQIIEYRENPIVERRQYLNNRDQQVLQNDLAPPERRVPEYLYPFNYIKNQLNIPTRGFPENYHLVGVLLRDNTETAYKLFGRQTYPGSDLWEYYVENDKYNNVKLPVSKRCNKEMTDGEEVHVPGTDKDRGHFRVKLYNFDVPRYIPIL